MKKGFTLIELLGVMLIIAILAATIFGLIPYTMRKTERMRVSKEVESIKMAIEEYHSTFGVYPPTLATSYIHEYNTPIVRVEDMHFQTGLVWHLYYGPENDRWDSYVEDIPVSDGISEYTEDVHIDEWTPPITVMWSNRVKTIRDAWFQEYRYSVGREFQSYQFWSLGPPNDPDGPIGLEGK